MRTPRSHKLTNDEYDAYHGSLKAYRDMKNILDTASDEARERGRQIGLEEGRKIGLEKGLTEAIDRLVKSGMSIEDAKRLLG